MLNDLRIWPKPLKTQTFGDDKVRVTKQIVRINCITLDQHCFVERFDWDDGKLEIAKFAYDHVYDLENYYKNIICLHLVVAEKKLDEYIQSKN